MSSLAPVLSPGDLTWAELQAARLDGDVYELADGYCLIGEFEGPHHRALAVLGARSPRLIAELATAAWIWGAMDEPARPTFAVTPAARTRLPPDRRASIREIVYADGDVTSFGSVRVTTPLRTALDLAKAPDDHRDFDPAVVLRLAALAGFTLDDCLVALRSRVGIRAGGGAEKRLTRAFAGGAVAESAVAESAVADQAVETR